MRTLRLQSPRMTGADVAAWQHFLAAQGFYTSTIDGDFGPLTAQATKAYQTKKGLTADGIVGLATYARAVHDGYQPPAGQVAIPGMDASSNCQTFLRCIAQDGMKFVVRYYAASQNVSKIITPQEAAALSAAGLQIAVVYEDGANVQDFNAATGRKHASRALSLAAGIGQPANSAIYFAADFNATAADARGPLVDYFGAVMQVLATAATRYAVGIYSDGAACRIIRDSGLAAFTWLSNSTSYRESNAFRPQADIVQIAPERNICNGLLNIDDDIAQSENFGAFRLVLPT